VRVIGGLELGTMNFPVVFSSADVMVVSCRCRVFRLVHDHAAAGVGPSATMANRPTAEPTSNSRQFMVLSSLNPPPEGICIMTQLIWRSRLPQTRTWLYFLNHEQRMTSGAVIVAVPDAVFLFADRRAHARVNPFWWTATMNAVNPFAGKISERRRVLFHREPSAFRSGQSG
jgi:hypothetical protein